jgi:hypothetical protein
LDSGCFNLKASKGTLQDGSCPADFLSAKEGDAVIKRFYSIILLIAIVSLQGVPLALAGSGVIPAGEADAKTALEKSPRHHEWVSIAVPNTEIKLSTFVAYPERKYNEPRKLDHVLSKKL